MQHTAFKLSDSKYNFSNYVSESIKFDDINTVMFVIIQQF